MNCVYNFLWYITRKVSIKKKIITITKTWQTLILFVTLTSALCFTFRIVCVVLREVSPCRKHVDAPSVKRLGYFENKQVLVRNSTWVAYPNRPGRTRTEIPEAAVSGQGPG